MDTTAPRAHSGAPVSTNTGALTAVQLEGLIARRTLGIKDLPTVPIEASALEPGRGVRDRECASAGVRRGRPPPSAAIGSGRFVRDDNDDVQYEFAAGTPTPSFVRRQKGNETTATRVP